MIRLPSHECTVTAKRLTIDLTAHLRHEPAIYEWLRTIQRIHIPIYLRNVCIDSSYVYENIVETVQTSPLVMKSHQDRFVCEIYCNRLIHSFIFKVRFLSNDLS